MRYATYVRRSGDKQEDERQISALAARCAEKGIIIPSHLQIVDVGERDIADKRPGWQQVMKLVTQRAFDVLLVDSFDRLGFNSNQQTNYYYYLFRMGGCHIDSLAEGRLTDQTDMVSDIKTAMHANNSRGEQVTKSWRLLSKRLVDAKSGDWLGGIPPFGYDIGYYDKTLTRLSRRIHYTTRQTRTLFDEKGKAIKTYTNTKTEKERIAIDDDLRPRLVLSQDPEEVAAVKSIFKLWVDHKLSLHKIAKRLNQSCKLRGKVFTHRNVQAILENPHYTGDKVEGRRTQSKYHDKVEGRLEKRPVRVGGAKIVIRERDKEDWTGIVENAHPSIIDRKMWEAAQEKLATADKDLPPQNPIYWLKGILYCGNCKGKMTPTPRGGKPSYVCLNHKRAIEAGLPSPCGTCSIRHDEAERLILNKCQELGKELARTDDLAEIARIKLSISDKEGELEKFFLRTVEQYCTQELAYAEMFEGKPELLQASLLASLKKKLKDLRTKAANPVVETLRKHGAVSPWSIWWEQISEMDAITVEQARAQLTSLGDRHKKLTLSWAYADETMQAIIRPELDRLKEEMARLQDRAIPLATRAAGLERDKELLLDQLKRAEAILIDDDLSRKAETVRGLFEKVFLPFDRQGERVSDRVCGAKVNGHRAENRHGNVKGTARPANNVRWILRLADVQFITKPVGQFGFSKCPTGQLAILRLLAV